MLLRLAALAVFCAALSAAQSPQFVWEGDVSDYCILRVHENQVIATDADGSPAPHQRYHFRAKLPDTNQTLRLQLLRGRGVVRFLSQPTLANNYTATVRIDDPQPGSSHYSIALSWTESPYDQPNEPRRKPKTGAPEPPAPATPADHGATWSGHVEGTVRVSIRGSSSYSQIVSGELRGEHADVLQPVPHRADLKYTVRKTAGGGSVQLIESPSDANGWTLTFEIRNGDSRDTEYAVDISWSPYPAPR